MTQDYCRLTKFAIGIPLGLCAWAVFCAAKALTTSIALYELSLDRE